MATETKAKKKKTSTIKNTAKKKMRAAKKAANKAAKARLEVRKTLGAKGSRPVKRKTPAKKRTVKPEEFSVTRPQVRPTTQSGDLQGLPRMQGADSESVAELVEEGNPFEAEVVTGVEAADDVREVRTHEVPEDDVPDEYFDKD
jgi:hypothetical protein